MSAKFSPWCSPPVPYAESVFHLLDQREMLERCRIEEMRLALQAALA